MDSEPVRNEREQRELLTRHYHQLQVRPSFSQSKFIFVPENMLGMEHHHLESMVLDLGVTTFWEKPDKPGVTKTAKVTRDYQFLLSNALAQNAIHFHDQFFTVTREQTAKSMLALAEEQLYRLHWDVQPIQNGKDRIHLTGKIGNLPDDLCIAICMALYWGRVIMNDPGRAGF